ncbi:MAG: PLP-dependent aspartate aminotransferase family protein [Lentisphaerae bacterium]|nr:PLP-dependent aspartate aminotransferase family protein [Lentisphaerota bacterium]
MKASKGQVTEGQNTGLAGFSTRAVHAGRGFNENTGAVMPPVFLTSTFAAGNPEGFDYTRSGNPNFRLLDRTLAALEGALACTSFASGVSAITAVASTLKSGDVVLAEENVYGCTYRLFDKVFAKFGVQTVYADLSDQANWSLIARHRPALVWLESPTNPLLKVIDIGGISEASRSVHTPVLVDNTFASPYLQLPLELGATLSLHSTTKYINGHSDCLAGAVITNDEEWHGRMIFAQKALGLQPSPFDAWLTARGARTLALRMERHSRSALDLAAWLEAQSAVKSVRYPFLPSHPQHALAKRQMRAGSGLILVELDTDTDGVRAFCAALEYFTLAESLGGVESLISHPATMTHASVPRAVREQVGIRDGLVRLSVGIEDVEDLRADLAQALDRVGRGTAAIGRVED